MSGAEDLNTEEHYTRSHDQRGVKRQLEEEPELEKQELSPKRPKLTEIRNINGCTFYVGEKILAIYEFDGLFYEATIEEILSGGKNVLVTWFNKNPKHRVVSSEDIQRLESVGYYVGEKIWAKYYPNGEYYIATVAKIDIDNKVMQVNWFNSNPEHRRVKISNCKKMTDLDREEQEQNDKDLEQEVNDLKFDLSRDVKELVPAHYVKQSVQSKSTKLQ